MTPPLHSPTDGQKSWLLPATGCKITLPLEHVRVRAQGDILINYEVEPVADGGVFGILKPMGVALPHA